MRFSQPILAVAVATMALGFSAGAASAHMHSYSGAWPVTITNSQRSNGTGCLTLTQGGRNGGQASLVFGGQKYSYGSFIVVKDILMATISQPLYGQNGALMFTAHASRGNIGEGLFEDIEGGSNFDFGMLAFGSRNGC